MCLQAQLRITFLAASSMQGALLENVFLRHIVPEYFSALSFRALGNWSHGQASDDGGSSQQLSLME